MERKKQFSVVVKDGPLRTRIGSALAAVHGQEHVRTFQNLEELENLRFSQQLIHIDALVLAPADAPRGLPDYVGRAQSTAPAARVIVVHTPGEALAIEGVACDVISMDPAFTKHIDAALARNSA